MADDLDHSSTKDDFRWVGAISCILSLFGSSAIILSYWFYPHLRKPARHLLVWLSVADFGTALIYLITIIACYDCSACNEHIKLLTSLIGVYFPVASFLWTDCIAVYVFGASYQQQWILPIKRLFCGFHIVSWTLPLISCITILAIYYAQNGEMQFSDGYTGGWCWVNRMALQIIGGKAVEIFSCVFLAVIYCATWLRMKRIQKSKKRIELMARVEQGIGGGAGLASSVLTSKRSATHFSGDDNKITTLLRRLAIIPLIFIALRIFGTLRVILVSSGLCAEDSGIDHTLQIFQSFCDPLQGFCNGVLFFCCVSEVRGAVFSIPYRHPRYYRDIIGTEKTTSNSGVDQHDTEFNTNTITSLSTPILAKAAGNNPLL